MPSRLKNIEANYQNMVNKMFINIVGKPMEVYIDYILVKSLQVKDHVKHLSATF